MKYLLVIGDGMADNSVPELGGKTPLEFAGIPALDALAARGVVGSVLNVPEGLPAGSDTAILSIFGCDPRVCYTGRAPLEAAAGGVRLSPGDVAYRCNMVTYEDTGAPFEEKKILSHSAGSIEGAESARLIKGLFDHPRFKKLAQEAGMTVYPALSFRHIAVQKGADIKGIVLRPPHDHLGETIGPLLPAGCGNAAVLKELMIEAHEILKHHPINEARRAAGKLPANGVWFWAEGTAVALPQFYASYGKTGAVVSAVPLCHGIAALAGLDVITVEGATGELETNYEGKVDAALDALKTHDFAAVHIEAPDECTHNGDLKGKLQAIEWIDSRVVAPLIKKLEAADFSYRLLVLSDHKTLTSTRGHDGDPVPFLLYDSRKDMKSGHTYSEPDGEAGTFVDAGIKLMGMLFEQTEK
ncbi:2,3-bisphosphoglycerate-independent phosphoglycerate mutase [Sporobacter termitidis DSM 10068]|uniref:2,3-bisphosphoglycerate-independent phosphoglycerate mutase n=1 Tax=Sporobacter termitidis DSM 10068 TaxID=1123282 RepID=A0A1M5X6S2_9FIRM|nr:cofactor-independent phosphoglycerate mutase [Sporobacter termitidis]SHH95194.1 2,3-bisphosphoglycerate-independent phosphoglycerate mutase [Sporobacter termitidis DSM 10068]